MTIQLNGKAPTKIVRWHNGAEQAVKKIVIFPDGVTEKQIRPVVTILPYLCFTANTASSTVKLNKTGSPTTVTLETSTDGDTRTAYTIGNTITLSNIGDKVYFRNTSETTTDFNTSTSNYYRFILTGSINASGDTTSLINKNCTNTLSGNYCFCRLFYNSSANSVLKTAPSLPATTLTGYCYYQMFYNCAGLTTAMELPATELQNYCYYSMFYTCSNLEQLPRLPAVTLKSSCYYQMFRNCSKIKLSKTQTGDYQTEYRVPITGTGTTATSSLSYMITNTGGTFTGAIARNTTYYTSNTLV